MYSKIASKTSNHGGGSGPVLRVEAGVDDPVHVQVEVVEFSH